MNTHTGLFLIGALFALIGWLVQTRLRKKMASYSKTQLLRGWSGREVAEKMLADHQLHYVKVMSVHGQLTDHYNPETKTVNLSHDVYHGHNTASAAVAAHECGHAVQHATYYSLLGLRSKLVPVVNVASTVMPWLLMLGVLLLSRIPALLLLAIAAQAAITLFTLITLPVEFDASKRALLWLQLKGVTVDHENNEAKDALKWAALTYVVSALAAVTQLIFLVLRYSNSRK